MGAWGAGSFENDTALDLIDEIGGVDDLQRALQLSDPDEEIDADQASRIIVVAEFLAAQRGHPCDVFPDELSAKFATIGFRR